VDDEVVRREAPADSEGSSELVLSALAPGAHHALVRVTEDGRASSLVEWNLEVPHRETETQVAVATPVRPRLVTRTPPGRIEQQEGELVSVAVGVEPEQGPIIYEWMLDGRRVQRGKEARLEQRTLAPGRHRLQVSAVADGDAIGSLVWTVVVRPSAIAAATPPVPPSPPPTEPKAVEAPPVGALGEAEIRAWLEEYAQAWSRKDVAALQRMGQVRNAADAERLEHYFHSIEALHVAVRVLALRVEGDRASVELERVDTVTDPTGRRQELRLPPLQKRIERTPDGLRFVDDGTRG